MSEKTRLLKLAPEIKVEVKEIVAYLKKEGMRKVSASSFVGAEVVQDIKDHFSGKKTQKTKAAAPEKPTQAETAEKPRPAPEVPAKTDEAAEPAAVKTAPAETPAEPAPPTVVEVKPRPPVPEIVPTAPPPRHLSPGHGPTGGRFTASRQIGAGEHKTEPHDGHGCAAQEARGRRAPFADRNYPPAPFQIGPDPDPAVSFPIPARSAGPASQPALGNQAHFRLPSAAQTSDPFPRPAGWARRTAPGPPPGQAGPAASWRAA